jgi:hypothetical protein
MEKPTGRQLGGASAGGVVLVLMALLAPTWLVAPTAVVIVIAIVLREVARQRRFRQKQ